MSMKLSHWTRQKTLLPDCAESCWENASRRLVETAICCRALDVAVGRLKKIGLVKEVAIRKEGDLKSLIDD